MRARTHASFVFMSNRSERIAKQLRDLMQRHDVSNAAQFARLVGQKKDSATVDQVTIRRILKGEVKTEPDPETLRRLCEALGEDYDVVFSDRHQVVVSIAQRQIGIKALDGRPLDDRLLSQLGSLMMPAAHDPTKPSYSPDISDDVDEERRSRNQAHLEEHEDRILDKTRVRHAKKTRP